MSIQTYRGGNLVLGEPIEELLLVVGSVAQVGGDGNSQLRSQHGTKRNETKKNTVTKARKPLRR
jgi:hypothetical protein